METIEATFEVINELGLHARPVSRLVQTAARFKSEVQVEREGQVANGKSVMGVLMLCCPKGSTITVRATGPDAQAALEAIGELARQRFGDPR
ncbi:MAG: HPr family phosphocarrier protein [Deltaproteobacteria bacterium]|nr:HPr family phosphocarrier protein [Deltaproteobacteria bacterium]